ncbi:MAG: AraC family transcriptional regulator [Cyanothece sp. SIO1E1]|nr:AraC family transcriptional regulator [Cyanothece sp. SIO1E1]
MINKSQIIQFDEMNDLYEYIGLKVRSAYPEFHIYKFEDFDEDCLIAMPPHSKNFYQISFITNYGDSQQAINTQIFKNINSIFYFIAPEHIYSWKRDTKISGYILNFKLEEIPVSYSEFTSKFEFFDLNKSNALFVDEVSEQRIVQVFENIYEEYHKPRKLFSSEMLSHLLLVLLYKCLNLYEAQQKTLSTLSGDQRLFIDYKNLVNKFYLSKRFLTDYAQLLNVSSNYLSSTIKKASGKPAAFFITNRLLLEAKNLLKFSNMDIQEICYTLNFSDPSHFGKFFKKNEGITPLSYRNREIPKK